MKPLGENDRRALLSLLADEDEHVQELLHEQFRAMGPDGCEFLESAARSAPAPARQTAARMLAEIRERHSVSAFQVFCREAGSDLNLERANWLLAKTRYPDLDEEPYLARLDQMAREIRGRLQDRVLFGTDYPFLTHEQWFGAWDTLGIPDEVTDKVLLGNATRLLGL